MTPPRPTPRPTRRRLRRTPLRRQIALGAAGLICALLGWAPSAPAASAQAAPPWLDLPLDQALERLADEGLRLVFTERLVPAELTVLHEPTARDPRRILLQLLAPHGLGVREGPGGVLVVIRHPRPNPPPPREPPVASTEPTETQVAGTTREAIEVRSYPPGIVAEGISVLHLDPLDLAALPAIADDPLRATVGLPGATARDGSAQLHVRGSFSDQVMVRLDGYEIAEPFHLQDFTSALSILAPGTLGSVELLSGGFPVQYGERAGAVLDLTSREPGPGMEGLLGLSVLQAEASGAGSFADARGRWLAAARLGSLELAGEVATLDQNPRFADLFAKADVHLGPRQSLRGHLLLADDRVDRRRLPPPDEADGADNERETFNSAYRNRYGWLTHLAVPGRRWVVENQISFTTIERERAGERREPSDFWSLEETRDHQELGVAHLGEMQMGAEARHLLKWGAEVRTLELDFDYANQRRLEDPLAQLRHQPAVGATVLKGSRDGRQWAAWLADQVHPGPALTVEVGVRFDKNTVLKDEVWSPRLSLTRALGDAGRVHLAWGLFHQSQRVYELQVEDGVEQYFPAERTEHRILGYDRTFWRSAGAVRPLTLRVEAYERRITDPRPRFENLFDPVSLALELEADRVRRTPSEGLARGVEVLLSGGIEGRPGRGLDWRLTAAWARARDTLDGVDVPRPLDQPVTFEGQLVWHAPGGLQVEALYRHHSGWPTTELTARRVPGPDGEPVIEVIPGRLYRDRLPAYNRLDLGLRRHFVLPRGELEAYLDVQNLSAENNLRGYDVDFEIQDDGTVDVLLEPEDWGPPIPSFGVRWRF